MTRQFIQTKSTSTTYGISSSSTTIQLKKLLKLDGTSISASDIGDLLYGTFAPGTSREEIFSIVGANVTVEVNGNVTITSVTRGLKEVAPYDSGGYSCDHPAGEVVVFGNNPQVYQYLKDYIDGIAIAAGVFSTTTTLGTSKLSAAALFPQDPTSPIVVATNDERIPTAYAIDSSGTDAYSISPSPALDDLFNANFEGMRFLFKAGTANTGPCTLSVSGAHTNIPIKKNVSEALVTGDILAGQIIEVVYDGTNMQLVSVISGIITSQSLTNPIVRTYLTAASPATWTKPAGLKYVEVEVQAGGQGGEGGGNSHTKGGTGGTSSFGSHCSATGGEQVNYKSVGGVGSNGDINITGQGGQAGTNTGDLATPGGASFFAGGGAGGSANTGGESGTLGGGGGGGGTATSGSGYAGGCGGAAGGYSKKLISVGTLGATETVTIGAGGGAGAGGSGNTGSGAGGAGIVIVTEYY